MGFDNEKPMKSAERWFGSFRKKISYGKKSFFWKFLEPFFKFKKKILCFILEYFTGDFVMFSLSNLMETCYSLFYLPLYLVSYLGLWLCSTSLSTSKTTHQFPLEDIDVTKEYLGVQIGEQQEHGLYQNNFAEYEAAGLTF